MLVQPSIINTNKRNRDVKLRPIVRSLYLNIKRKMWVTFQEVIFVMFLTLLLNGEKWLYSPSNFLLSAQSHYAG